jgi:hypothetical protein
VPIYLYMVEMYRFTLDLERPLQIVTFEAKQ